MKKRKPKTAKRTPRRDENQSAFDAVKHIIERTEKPKPLESRSPKSTH